MSRLKKKETPRQRGQFIDPKKYFHKKLMKKGPWEKRFNKQNRLWKIFVIGYFLALFLSSDYLTAGYFLNHRLGITTPCLATYRIAIIDSAFDLSQLPAKNIVAPRNVTDRSSIISKTPIFDYSGNLKFSNHGTDIMGLFIGPHGLLPNTEIIPIQVHSAADLPAALEHALHHGAQAISISLSFDRNYRPIPFVAKDALLKAAKHVPIVIAAGNDGLKLESHAYGQSLLSAAKASSCGVNGKIFIVSSTKFSIFGFGVMKHEHLSNFSNYSNSQHVIKAPGENIKLGNLAAQTFGINSLNGTSIATPLALIKAIYLVNNPQNSGKITLVEALEKL